MGTGPWPGRVARRTSTNGGLTVPQPSRATRRRPDRDRVGRAITAVGAGPTKIIDSTFAVNRATGDTGATGGALHAPTEVVDVTGSTFTLNTADGDTGTAGRRPARGDGERRQLDLVGERGHGLDHRGRGVYVFAGISLRHATVVDNRAAVGAAVAVQGAVTTFASVLTSDPLSGDECSVITPTVTLGYNYPADDSCGLTGSGDVEDGAVPVVDELAANGGPTFTHRPRAELIDAIPSDDCAVDLPTDQRGRPRPEGSGCDIGSVEAGFAVDQLVRRGRQATFRGDGVVNLDGTDQTLRTIKPRGYEAVFVLRIENDGEFEDIIRLRGRRGSERFGVRYLSGGEDVTADVVAGTFQRLLAPGGFRVVRARVLVNDIAPHGIERVLPVRATSVGLPARPGRGEAGDRRQVAVSPRRAPGPTGPSRAPGSSGTRGRARPSRPRPARGGSRGRFWNGTPMSTWWARCQPVLYGTIQKRASQRLARRVGGAPAVVGAGHPAVLGDGPQPVEHPPHGHPRGQPEQRVQPRPADRR